MAMVCLIGVAACTGGEAPDKAGPTTPPDASPVHISTSPTPSTPPPLTSETKACGGKSFDAKTARPYNRFGPRYAGPGVHPTVLFFMHYYEDPYVPKLPLKWQAQQGITAQLVVCEYFDDSFRGERVHTCTYNDGSTAWLRSARYVYRVFEAKTGKLIRRFTLRGSLSSCPAMVYGSPTGPYYEYVASGDLRARLRPLVTGKAG